MPRNAKAVVLVVDDEATVLDAMCRTLKRTGRFEILASTSFSAALAQIGMHSGTIDVAVLDVALPERSGLELAAELKKLHPRVKVLFVSGRSGAELLPYSRLSDQDRNFLPKPFTPAELLKRVDELLTQESSQGMNGS
jgi:DNA-binding response OmpR family regulator